MNYIDLGLSVKWSDCNIGADSPCDAGGYYSFNEIRDVKNLPTEEQWKELLSECEFKYDKARNGFRVISKNGNEIFFPIAGEKDGQVEHRTEGAFYWTGTECEYDKGLAWYAFITRKVYGKKIYSGTGAIERNKFHISARTVEG